MAGLDQRALTKAALRTRMKQQRIALDPAKASGLSEDICSHIFSWEVYQKASIILAYYPLGGEADIRPVLFRALAEGRCVALPKVTGKHSMAFYRIKSLLDCIPGAFGVMEPGDTCSVLDVKSMLTSSLETAAINPPGLMLVPGLAFCKTAVVGRMGYGGGFYDTWLNTHFPVTVREHRDALEGTASFYSPGLVTCGVAYDFQVVGPGEIPLEAHDRPLDALVTNCMLYTT